jgi:hypothetical protein
MTEAMKPAHTLSSDGEPSARAYAVVIMPSRTTPEPLMEPDRVVITDPHRTVTVGAGATASSGPRDPEQTQPLRAKSPGIELPDGLPLSKAQRIWVDPDQIAAWEEEERRKRPAR